MARNISFSTPAVQYGLIAGVVYALGLTILYLLGDYYLAGTVGYVFTYRLIPYIFVVAIGVYAGIAQKNMQAGYITFVKALLTILLALLIAEAFYIFTMWLMYNVIDPELAIRTKELIIQQTRENLSSMGLAEKEIEKAVVLMEAEQVNYGLKYILLSSLTSILLSVVIALISAAIIKKEEPQYFTRESAPIDAN